jgi:hypothetical protein
MKNYLHRSHTLCTYYSAGCAGGYSKWDALGQITSTGIGTFNNNYCVNTLGWDVASTDPSVLGSLTWCEANKDAQATTPTRSDGLERCFDCTKRPSSLALCCAGENSVARGCWVVQCGRLFKHRSWRESPAHGQNLLWCACIVNANSQTVGSMH